MPGMDAPVVELQLTLADLPANLDQVPSMRQAADLAWDIERVAGFGAQAGVDALFPNNHWMRLAIGAPVTYGLGFVVPTGGWAHEEWHRAVLSDHGLPSVNPYNNPARWFDDLGSVNGMQDEQLANFKAADPAGFVYLSTAGFDAGAELVRRTEDDLFFGDEGTQVGAIYFGQSPMLGFLLNHRVGTLLYHGLCASADTDALIADAYIAESSEDTRDFTGPDCTAWAYDLLRAEETYSARGTLEDGSTDRYRGWSDLSDDERTLVENTVLFDLVALADPHLFALDGFHTGETRFTASVEHGLRPFGRSVDLRFKLRTPMFGGWVVLKNGLAGAGWMPGVEAGIRPVVVGRQFAVDGNAELWLQPTNLLFHATERSLGGAAEAGLRYWPTDHLGARLGLEGKSTGYRRGNPNLDPDVNAKLSLLARW